jgi:hypothetical protein
LWQLIFAKARGIAVTEETKGEQLWIYCSPSGTLDGGRITSSTIPLIGNGTAYFVSSIFVTFVNSFPVLPVDSEISVTPWWIAAY